MRTYFQRMKIHNSTPYHSERFVIVGEDAIRLLCAKVPLVGMPCAELSAKLTEGLIKTNKNTIFVT